MININNHPIWKGQNAFQKQGNILKQKLAKQYSKIISPDKFIGVLGTVGKTITAVACKEVLSEKFNTVSSTDTAKDGIDVSPLLNIPNTILKMKPKTEKAILELGIGIPGEMDFLLQFVQPKTLILTNLSFDSMQGMGDINVVVEENLKALKNLPPSALVIVNWDDLESRKIAESLKSQVVFYGTDKETCHVWVNNIKVEDGMTSFELNYGVERVEIRSKLLGKHQIYPLLAAAALGLSLDIPLFTLKKALERVKPLPHRMQLLSGFNNSTIINDSYDIQLIDLTAAIRTLNEIPARRRILVLGEIKEMGELSEKIHKEVGRIIYENRIDLVFTGLGDVRYTEDELLSLGFVPERLSTNNQNPQLVSKLLKTLNRGDVVLIKGSRSNRFDEVVEKLSKNRN